MSLFANPWETCLIILLCFLNVILVAYTVILVMKHNKLKKFSNKFVKDLQDGKEEDRDDFVCVEDHQDFIGFKGTQFLTAIIDTIAKKKINPEKTYGFCAILAANYGFIKGEIIQEAFVINSSTVLSKIQNGVNENLLISQALAIQKIFLNNEEITDFTMSQWIRAVKYMNPYLTYHYCIDDTNGYQIFEYVLTKEGYQVKE